MSSPVQVGIRGAGSRTGCEGVFRGRALLAAAGALALLAATASPAADKPRENTFEITPFIGQMGGGEFEDPTSGRDRDVASDLNWGLFLNINADSPARQYEFFYTRQSTEIEGAQPIDLDVQYLQVGGIVNFTDVERVVPYFGMTVGATRLSPSGSGLDDETKLSFSVGGGAKIPITDHIGVRFDARAFITLLDTDGSLFCASGEQGGTCLISASSDTFVQYSVGLGLIAAF